MPATPSANERHYTEEPDDGLVTCPDCEGAGYTSEGVGLYGILVGVHDCPYCDGTGYISAERAAEDAAEAHGDLLMEMARDAAIEHATGFEE